MPKTTASTKYAGMDAWRALHYGALDSFQALAGIALTTTAAYELWGVWAGVFALGLLAKVDIWIDGITLAIGKDKI